jgi:hypothetical protein
MYEDKEVLLKQQNWEKLLELSNYFYTEYSLCKKISYENNDTIGKHCEPLFIQHKEYEKYFLKAFNFFHDK